MKRILLMAALSFSASMLAQEKPAERPATPAENQPPKKKTLSDKSDEARKARLDEEALMPSLSRSPTGYVEDAAVGNEIRLRFDAGWNINSSDRAGFYYAQCTFGCHPATFAKPVLANLRYQEIHVNVEHALSRRISLFIDGSGRGIQPNGGVVSPTLTSLPSLLLDSHNGAGDTQAGLKLAPIASPSGYLTFQFRSYLPTGNAKHGLGTDHYSIEPSVLFTRKITSEIALSGQFSAWHPLGGLAVSGDVLTYGAGANYQFRIRDNLRVSPVVEFVGWRVLSGLVSSASEPDPTSAVATIVNGKIGARIQGRNNSFYAGFGRQLSHVGWYRDLLRVEYSYYF